MSDLLFCYVTTANLQEAQNLARGAVDYRLAACANILPSMTSIYEWKGKTEESSESVVILKTSRAQIQELEKWIQSRHSYECPCIVWWELDGVHKPYGDWLRGQLGPSIEK